MDAPVKGAGMWWPGAQLQPRMRSSRAGLCMPILEGRAVSRWFITSSLEFMLTDSTMGFGFWFCFLKKFMVKAKRTQKYPAFVNSHFY